VIKTIPFKQFRYSSFTHTGVATPIYKNVQMINISVISKVVHILNFNNICHISTNYKRYSRRYRLILMFFGTPCTSVSVAHILNIGERVKFIEVSNIILDYLQVLTPKNYNTRKT